MARFVDGLYDRWHNLSDWFYYDVPRRSKRLGLMAVVVMVCAAAFWLLRPSDSSESGSLDGSSRPDSSPSVDETLAQVESGDERRSETSAVTVETTVSTSRTTTPTEPTESTESPESPESPEPTAPALDSNSVPSETTTATTTTTAATTATTTATPAPPATDGSTFGYPTGSDGLPLPVVVVFDTETITISGQVPSQAAKERIEGLAIANSQFPDATVIDDVAINPAVPISVGVRVIELNAARFPEGSAEILPEHALELDRVVNIMKTFPNISVLVVGHADQRGDEASNSAISDQRARAVVNYLRYLGISPTRASSQAAGESDLLAAADDPLSLALNRRTEFIFYGLLIE